ncbi:TIGR03985 family CRISPR-associated protein [Calothrix sp. UHCC 0171]|uniref:TIGR03985 family CRISPR-associated protein n=1 Tax=Calothrix sp. UHCC 0171 TaxID=3110245 RepID=UPI002B2053ED|nr:TIGR03985 family CRISPR-associated protein [Calothrix sp. UHCC 0171]MEA5573536.1 TIGR03985 family CRISPR-associated protein [Calothrix sp. UHCC 0171]
MQEPYFLDIPHVDLLQWFARGSLKQNLPRAIRLWVWLRSLYGESRERLLLEDGFTYAQWRDNFFLPSHPKDESIPQSHDINCNCAKSTAEWLFSPKYGVSEDEWKHTLITHVEMIAKELDKILQQRLFGVTRRTLQGDLQILVDLGWLVYINHQYYRVREFPFYPVNNSEEKNQGKLLVYENFLQEDLSAIAQNHSDKINGIQRFFVHLDYVIPKSTIDAVDNCQWELKEIWTKNPVPPVELTYSSAKVGGNINCVIFPVCIYYFQRAVYLCGYGESPDRTTNWYNFRLDHIQAMTPLKRNHDKIPENLQQRYQNNNLPNPDEIAIALDQAWGFDFYLPPRLMILRFDADYDERYIKNSNRHSTFRRIEYEQIESIICQYTKDSQQIKAFLDICKKRSSHDAYYQVMYRHKDNGIIMRLRAWGGKCEVLFPLDLRRIRTAEIAAELKLYHT